MIDSTGVKKLSRPELAELIEAICGIAFDAGQAILLMAQEINAVKEKSDGSPLTQADLLSHKIIVDSLSRLKPAIPILSEEDNLLGSYPKFRSYMLKSVKFYFLHYRK